MTASNESGALHGRTAIVTGGAGNLGRAISLSLRNAGCRVVVIDQGELAPDFSAEPNITAVSCDLLSEADTATVVRDVCARFSPVSILVNAVGNIYSAPLINIANPTDRRHSFGEWKRVMETNLNTVFLATANVVERMVAARTRGVVVNLSSISAAGNAGQGAYSAAKAGVNAITLAWAKELGPLGIRFVAIAPGFVDTETTRSAMSDETIKEWVRRTPLRRLGSVADVTSAVLFAITNDQLTGKVIEIDGGLTL